MYIGGLPKCVVYLLPTINNARVVSLQSYYTMNYISVRTMNYISVRSVLAVLYPTDPVYTVPSRTCMDSLAFLRLILLDLRSWIHSSKTSHTLFFIITIMLNLLQ